MLQRDSPDHGLAWVGRVGRGCGAPPLNLGASGAGSVQLLPTGWRLWPPRPRRGQHGSLLCVFAVRSSGQAQGLCLVRGLLSEDIGAQR